MKLINDLLTAGTVTLSFITSALEFIVYVSISTKISYGHAANLKIDRICNEKCII